jgi:uncharacterized protein (TIGR02145 family)
MRTITRLVFALIATAIVLTFAFANAASEKNYMHGKRLMGFIQFETIKTVTIGTQVWTAENLSVDKFRNGEIIPEAKTAEDWTNLGLAEKPCWCYYDFDTTNGRLYGKLYNWFAVNDKRGLAPTGFHIPTQQEWLTLLGFIGAAEIVGGKLKSKDGWGPADGGKNGEDTYGFRALPGGYFSRSGYGQDINDRGMWWSATFDGGISGYAFWIYGSFPDLMTDIIETANGLSVRCVKNK